MECFDRRKTILYEYKTYKRLEMNMDEIVASKLIYDEKVHFIQK